MNYSLFHVEGGLGKNIAATAVARCIKKNHPDRELIVVCSYPEVFLHLSFVHKVFRIGVTPYFYQEYIQDEKTKIFKHEPYFAESHIYKRKSLVETWCELYGLKYEGEQPELNISKRVQELVSMRFSRQKPIMLLHTNGGLFQGQERHYSWTRDMPKNIAEAVSMRFANEYHIMQICRTEFNIVAHAEGIIMPLSNLELFSLLYLSKKRLFIDSCMQHAAAALEMPSTVLWIATSPKIFGYKLHKNIQAKEPINKPKLPDSYLFDYDFNGNIHDYPYGVNEDLFDVKEIIESLS